MMRSHPLALSTTPQGRLRTASLAALLSLWLTPASYQPSHYSVELIIGFVKQVEADSRR